MNLFDFDTGDYSYLLAQMGKDVLINNKPTKALITNTNLNTKYDDRKISSLSPLDRGDFVYYEGNKFMIISEQSGERYNKFKGIMRHLPHTIKVNHDCNFIELDCYIDGTNFSVTDGKVINIAEGNIYVHTQNNENTRQISIDDRFIKDGQVFKVEGVDTLSRKGIITFTCAKDLFNPARDNMEEELAGYYDCLTELGEPTEPEGESYIIITSASSPNEIKRNQSKTYNAEVYINGELVNEPVTWSLYADDRESTTDLAHITDYDDVSCTVKNNAANSGYVQLKATSDSGIEGWMRIQMKPLF